MKIKYIKINNYIYILLINKMETTTNLCTNESNCKLCCMQVINNYYATNNEKICKTCFMRNYILKELICDRCETAIDGEMYILNNKDTIIYSCNECALSCSVCDGKFILGNPGLQGGTGVHCDICFDPVCENCLRDCKSGCCKNAFICSCCVTNDICSGCKEEGLTPITSEDEDEKSNNNRNNDSDNDDNNDSDNDNDNCVNVNDAVDKAT